MSSLPDKTEYLSATFNPASVTVAQLRGILFQHDIFLPSATKPDLIKQFNENIASQRETLLAAHVAIKPSSQGITDARSSQSGVRQEEDVPKHRKQGSRRPAKRQLELGEDANSSNAGAENPPKARKSHRSRVKKESPDTAVGDINGDIASFTPDSPTPQPNEWQQRANKGRGRSKAVAHRKTVSSKPSATPSSS